MKYERKEAVVMMMRMYMCMCNMAYRTHGTQLLPGRLKTA